MRMLIQSWRTKTRRAVRVSLEKMFRPPAEKFLRHPGKVYESLVSARGAETDPVETISLLTQGEQPLCVGRFGRTELQMAQRWRSKQFGGIGWQVLDSLASGDPHFYFRRAALLLEGTGIRPLTSSVLERFYELTVNSLREVDVLGSWAPGEMWFEDELTEAKIVTLHDLEPYRHPKPWSSALEGKKVLVIHPYVESITSQYEKYGDRLFGNKGVLPPFILSTYRPPQAYFGEIPGAEEWFDHLDRMVADMRTLDFDIAIIGAGPFGMPLAAAIKRMGRQALHLGGATQLLFGIHGNRWSSDPVLMSITNEYWTKPLPSETPPVAQRIEKGAYW